MENNEKEIEQYLEQVAHRSKMSGVTSVLECNAGIFQMGDIFEAETTRGHKNYIVFFFVKNGFVYWCHGDKAKKTRVESFLSLIDYGDLVPVPREKADPERLALSVLGLKAMSQGMAFNDYMKVLWGEGTGSEATNYA